ncbi:DUF6461 domain-containing protein [Kitasatospora hibisci]|uniref:DUF6461 domain-containing protein n=1 Tax=Kitasatospora hibisci TaxID=3369522 RepID=UPI0037542987
MAAHATDFTWFEERYADLAEAYCLTLVQGLSAEQLLDRFAAVPGRRVTGLRAVVEAWDAFEDGEDDTLGDDEQGRMLIAVTRLDGWALAVEVNGYLGTTWTLLPGLTEGTRLVSHFRNVNAVDHFHWWEDGRTRLHFEPLFPGQRDGSDADAPGIPELLTHCGFLLADDDRGGRPGDGSHTRAAFALAERLTDVRLTAEALESAEYVLGYAPEP